MLPQHKSQKCNHIKQMNKETINDKNEKRETKQMQQRIQQNTHTKTRNKTKGMSNGP